ncbi:Gfo/Idh/MocA family protein [Halorientalis brevis]|uniref:Gfo/Idh/MocA family protein n=1 Tax=Halorientalis brevis TaxID=1126241 RepID=A0ABD6CDP8_9EURY|nr:Gfo/Idh/MocA family oxidoreductase [Halorientalis brevis]
MALRTAVVGGGTISGRHLDGLSDCPYTDLVGICDVDADRARSVASEYGIANYTDMQELLDDANLDWVHICTPVATHLDLATMAIEAGVPVLIQKPVTETVEEYERLKATAEKHDVPVSVVHNHDFDPAMRKLTAAIEDGAVGDVRSVEVRYAGQTYPDDVRRGEWAFQLPGGEFEEGIPHPLYLLLRVGGYPRDLDDVQVSTHLVREYDRPFTYDGTKVQYVSDSDVLCSTTLLPGDVPDKGVHVHGDDGVLIADLVSQTLVRLDRDYQASAINRALSNVKRAADRLLGNVDNLRAFVRDKRSDEWDVKTEMNSHYYQFEADALALEGRGERPVPLEEAGWTIRLMEAIREAAADQAAVTQDASVTR